MNNKVLVVEDSRAFRNYLVQQLSGIGCQVLSAETYQEAQEILNSNDDFLFAVLDYCLPDAENGEVIDLVLEHKQKVIVLTATFCTETRSRFIAKGVVDYILKDSMSSVSYLLPLANRLMNNSQHHALVVDDSATVRQHVAQLLEHQYIRTTQAQNGLEALHKLASTPDITFVITDHDMPEKDGISMTREIRQLYDKNSLAVLGLSASSDQTITARFLKAGANDFLHKPFNNEEFYCRVHQVLDMKEVTDKLFKLANQDMLTGLWNRRYLFDHVSKNVQKRNIAMIDIDHFKLVNDTYGHEGGDKVLTYVGQQLNEWFKADIAVRFGGEEFCIFSAASFDNFVTRLEQLRKKIEDANIDYKGQAIKITLSIGVSSVEGELEEQIRMADDRLYKAKASGRNRLISE